MSGIIGSKLNIRGSGRIAKLGTDGQVLTSSGAGVAAAFEDVAGGTSWQSVETGATFTAVAGNGYPVNTTAQSCTITLPAGSVGDTIEFVDYAGTWDTNYVTLTADGSENIKGSTDDVALAGDRQGIKIVYVDATQGWVGTTGVNETAPALKPPPFNVDFLVIAGGGGGSLFGGSGGGGAGGYRNSYSSESSGGGASAESDLLFFQGTTYTIAVGAGGVGSASTDAQGAAGTDSSISGADIVTKTSVGGGAGNHTNGNSGAEDGGSGGGSGGSDGQQGTGTANQGYDGGSTGAGGAGSGGGGAGAVGVNTDDTNGAAGGVGLESSITGSAATRAGGGGGATYTGTQGAGGTGGGGTGGKQVGTIQGSSGTANTGGGAGAKYSSTPSNNGGSGVVILRIATADYSGTSSGAETPIVDGSDTILVFNGDGSYTA